jgi:hypothetical protein
VRIGFASGLDAGEAGCGSGPDLALSFVPLCGRRLWGYCVGRILRRAAAHQEWEALRAWVEQLVVRFAHLDHHVIPRCWFRHNGHVEALVALRDQERVNYSDTAPGSAAVDWHRAFRDIEARLREWTGQLACGATHEVRAHQVRSVDSDVWRQFVNEDVTRRQEETVNGPLAE